MVNALLKGLAVTFKHIFIRPVTVSFPEQRRKPPPRFKGRHRLARHPDGREKCIGCSLCAAACPADAIYVKAAPNPPGWPYSDQERYAEEYKIDMIRCIFCGLCVEACPTEALLMTDYYELSEDERNKTVWDKREMLDPIPPTADAAVAEAARLQAQGFKAIHMHDQMLESTKR